LEVEKPSDSFIGETDSFGPVETAGARKKVENLAEHLKTSNTPITHMEGHSLANRTQPCLWFQRPARAAYLHDGKQPSLVLNTLPKVTLTLAYISFHANRMRTIS
jgi:hypothetical protein